MTRRLAVIGGGPAGLMAAEAAVSREIQIDVFDAMPSLGRKFLMAGKGGMNITHAEPYVDFLSRYGEQSVRVAEWLEAFGPEQVRSWIHQLGIETFVGSSGRVFPVQMKAAPLLRAWLHRLRASGVNFHVRHRWLGWEGDQLRFSTPDGEREWTADAVILALGGGSWARLGSDGAWVPWLQRQGIDVAPLHPANCGFNVTWSSHMRTRFAGQPVKPVVACHGEQQKQGEITISEYGIEGGLVYALSASLRDALMAEGHTQLHVDLAPGRSLARLQTDLAQPRGRDSLTNHLRRRAGIDGVKAALLYEFCSEAILRDPGGLAAAIKCLPVPIHSPRPIDEAISTAGGVRLEQLDRQLMVKAHPGLFVAGEMLDWEAPTGGYLLTACLASGRAAGQGAKEWLLR